MLYNIDVTKNREGVYLVLKKSEADTLARFGLPAVSPPDGFKQGWKDEYTDFFYGRDVAILHSADRDGEKFASLVSVLIGSSARTTRTVCVKDLWPDADDESDISDFFDVFDRDGVANLKNAVDKTEPCARSDNVMVPEFYAGRSFLHNVMGDYLIAKYGVCKINGAIHIYDNGVYRQGEELLHGFMLDVIPTLTDAKRREVYRYIKASRSTPEKKVSPPHLIPFASRIYDVENDCFIDYTPEHVFLNRFPYDYNPDAPDSDIVRQTVRNIAGGDKDVIMLLYEAMGNCFYMLNSFRGAVMLYGKSGNNGKSTLLNMIVTMLGEENACYLSLQDTAERFRLADVYGKVANIGDDIPASYLPESSIFKKLVTGERVTAEKKGQDPFSFKPYAKMFFAMNGLPPISDKTKAFFGRLLLIPLNQDFDTNGLKDVRLKDRKWTKEDMECLVKYAMYGLKRLLKDGDFIRPKCVLDALAEYEAENNPVREFLDEYGEVEGKTTQEVYDHFTAWCWRNGHRNTVTRKRFTREVCDQTGYKNTIIRFGNRTLRGFVAI